MIATKKKTTKKKSVSKTKTTKKKTTKKIKKSTIRVTKKWKDLYNNCLEEKSNFSSKEKFNEYIDKLYNIKTIDQNNILKSFKTYIGKK